MAAAGRAVPALHLEVQFATRWPWVPGRAALRRWATAALSAGVVASPAKRRGAAVGGAPKRGVVGASRKLALRIVGAAESRRLDRVYRGKDRPTNVLSFPASPEEQRHDGALGDLVICAPVVAREAREQRKPREAHWAHMVVHGTLHLLGYDHERSGRAARAMEGLEVEILRRLGFDDPYLPVTHKAV